MRRAWLVIRIGATPSRRTKGRSRTILVDASHGFDRLAEALNLALGRWDDGRDHTFRLADGRRIDPAAKDGGGPEVSAPIGSLLGEGDEFVFQIPTDAIGCRVLASSLEPPIRD